jgi:hypothetical protein
MSEVEEPSAPSIDAETHVPDIMDTISHLSSKSMYEDLRQMPKNPFKREYRPEDFAKPEEVDEPMVVEETPELLEFERGIQPFEELLAPVASKKNWLSEKIDTLRRKFRERPRRRFVALRTANDVQEFFQQNSLGTKNVQPFNPGFTIEKNTRIAKLIAYSSPAHLLKNAGLYNLNSEKLAENGVVLQDLRNYRRYPSDLPTLFEDIHRLHDAGFTRFHFDSCLWTLHDIAKAYGISAPSVAGYFGMTVRDLIAADVKPQELPKFNVKMANIMADPKPFELLFALRMNPIQLQKAFGFQPAHLFNADGEPLLPSIQIDILHTFANWSDADMRRVGFTNEQLESLCVPPQLNLENIKQAIVGSRMRQRK